jgi:hypothetical protein
LFLGIVSGRAINLRTNTKAGNDIREGIVQRRCGAPRAEAAIMKSIWTPRLSRAPNNLIRTREIELKAILGGHDNVSDFAQWLHDSR